MIDEEGWENVIKRHELLKTMTREGVKALGIPLLTNDKEASPTVTAVMPKDDQANAIRKIMKDKYHISLAGGQQKLSGKIFRIGHMGYCNPYDVLTVLAALEMTIKEMENKDVLGLATKRAQEVWAEHV